MVQKIKLLEQQPNFKLISFFKIESSEQMYIQPCKRIEIVVKNDKPYLSLSKESSEQYSNVDLTFAKIQM